MSILYLTDGNYLRALTSEDYKTLTSWVKDPHTCSRWPGSSVVFPFNPKELPGLLKKRFKIRIRLKE